MSRRMTLVGFSFAVLIGVVLMRQAFAESKPIPAEWLEGRQGGRGEVDALQGKAPPALKVKNWINSNELKLEDLKGKVVMIDFWATWCGPCIASIPHANDLQARFKDKGLVIIGVCHSKGAEKMVDVVKEKGILYPVAADIDGGTVGAYKANSFPDYYFIDRAGNLRIADCANGQIDKAIELLLAEPAPGK